MSPPTIISAGRRRRQRRCAPGTLSTPSTCPIGDATTPPPAVGPPTRTPTAARSTSNGGLATLTAATTSPEPTQPPATSDCGTTTPIPSTWRSTNPVTL